MAQYAEETVKNDPRLELVTARQSFTVCFRYVPSSETDLNAFNLELSENLRKQRKSIVYYGYIGKTLVLRLVMANSEIDKKDIDSFFNNVLNTAEQTLENRKVYAEV